MSHTSRSVCYCSVFSQQATRGMNDRCSQPNHEDTRPSSRDRSGVDFPASCTRPLLAPVHAWQYVLHVMLCPSMCIPSMCQDVCAQDSERGKPRQIISCSADTVHCTDRRDCTLLMQFSQGSTQPRMKLIARSLIHNS